MNPWRPTKIEWITFFVIMPLLDVVMNYLLFGNRVFDDYRIWAVGFPLIFLIGFCSWYFHISSMHLLRVKLPGLKETGHRLMLLFFITLIQIFLTMWIIFYGLAFVHFLDYVT